MHPDASSNLPQNSRGNVGHQKQPRPRKRNVVLSSPTQPAEELNAFQDPLELDPIENDPMQPAQRRDNIVDLLEYDAIESDSMLPAPKRHNNEDPLVYDLIESDSMQPAQKGSGSVNLLEHRSTQEDPNEEACLPLPEEDDPQVDWRTTQSRCGPAEQDDIDDYDVRPTQIPSSYQVPNEVLQAENAPHSVAPMPPYVAPIHEVYTKVLTRLCRETATEYMETFVLQGLPFVVLNAESILLDREHIGESLLYAFALVVHVWQVVGYQAHHGSFPKQDESLSMRWVAHLLSAHSIVDSQIRNGRCSVDRFRFAVQHWESRIFDKGGRDIWTKAEWLRRIDGPIPRSPISRNDTADEYLRILETEGKVGLAFCVLKNELAGPVTPLRTHLNPNRPEEKKWAVSEIFGIFNGMNIETLKALIDGSLSRKAEIPFREVWGNLQHINRPQITRPSIYCNCICDAMGISPTPAQWKMVCEKMSYYTQPESNKFAVVIDQLIYPSKRWPKDLAFKNLRRYTEWRSWLNDGDSHPDHNHRKMVRYFVSQMLGRLENQPEHVPLSAPVVEIGFSIDSHERLKQHAHHRNSNYLMNLSEAMFEHCFPGCFRLQQHIIFNCYSKEQPWLGEIVLTQLGQGYTEGAGGFSHHPAGNSNGSAYRKTSQKEWDAYEAEAFSDGKMDAELDREKAWAEERRKRKEAAKELEKERLQRFGDLVDSMRKFTEGARGSGD